MCAETNDETNQFPTKVKNLSMEILSILHSRDLSHDELVSFRRRYIESFSEYQKKVFPTVSNEHLMQIENRLKQQQQQQFEAQEKEKRAMLAKQNQEKMCSICSNKTMDWKTNVQTGEIICTSCSMKFIKKEGELRMV
ncbi:GATA-type domain-containing protein [Entamoeba marina]